MTNCAIISKIFAEVEIRIIFSPGVVTRMILHSISSPPFPLGHFESLYLGRKIGVLDAQVQLSLFDG